MQVPLYSMDYILWKGTFAKSRSSETLEPEYFEGPSSGFWGWEAGSEVQISYGAKSNSHLVMCHGFVIDDNPHDRYLGFRLSFRVKGLMRLSRVDMFLSDDFR